MKANRLLVTCAALAAAVLVPSCAGLKLPENVRVSVETDHGAIGLENGGLTGKITTREGSIEVTPRGEVIVLVDATSGK